MLASGDLARHDLRLWGVNGASFRAESNQARSRPVAVPIAGVAGGSVGDALRRSVRAVQVLLAGAILVAGITAYAVAGVLIPRVDHLNAAITGLNQARSGLQQEQSALASYLTSGDRAALTAYSQAKADVAAGDAQVLRSGLGGHDVLTKLISVRSAEQAWTVGYASQVLAAAQPGTGGVAALQVQGNQLFAAYLSASSHAIADLTSRSKTASNDQREVAIAGLSAEALLVVAVGLLVGDHRRLATKGFRRAAESLAAVARQIEFGEGADLPSVRVPVELQEVGSVVVSVARDLQSLRAAINMSATEADARNRKLLQVLELTRVIGGNLSLRPVMDSIAAASVKLSGSARGVLWIAGEGELRAATDTGGGVPAHATEPPEAVVQAATYGRSSRSGMARPPAGQQVVDIRDSLQDAPSVTEAIPRLAVPMTFTGRVVGVIELIGGAVAELNPDDIELVETLASNGASAIEAARSHAITESLSLTDALTHLPNRRQLENDLSTETERARRYERSSALIMLDVDGFKAFNDKYGHQAGDQVLAQFGELLAASIRASDSAYRYGGEEFAVLVREASLEAAVDLAERLREAVAERFSDLPPDAPVTASFGVVGVQQVEPEPAVLIRAADEALYTAKERGRNRVVAFK